MVLPTGNSEETHLLQFVEMRKGMRESGILRLVRKCEQIFGMRDGRPKRSTVNTQLLGDIFDNDFQICEAQTKSHCKQRGSRDMNVPTETSPPFVRAKS